MIGTAVIVRQRDAARAWNQLQDQVLNRHHHIEVIAGSLASNEDGVNARSTLLWWDHLRTRRPETEQKDELLEDFDVHVVLGDRLIGWSGLALGLKLTGPSITTYTR